MANKFTYQQVKILLEKRGYKLLSKRYRGCTEKIKVKCEAGHIFKAIFNNLNHHKTKCPACNNKKRLSLKEVKEFFKKEGYIVLEKTYKSVDMKIKTVCPNNHIYTVTFYKFKKGTRCTECSGYSNYTKKEIEDILKKENYLLLNTLNFINVNKKIDILCPKNHIWNVSFRSYHNNGARCPICQKCGTSSEELELFDILKITNPKIIKKRYKTVINEKPHIKRFELDILSEENNRAIEYDGRYHHSEKYLIQSKTEHGWPIEDARNYHEIKDSYFLLYKKIEILHIKGDDWKINKDYCIKLSDAWLQEKCSIWPKPKIINI